MSTKQKLLKARGLIRQKKYNQARSILHQIEHPVAKEWLAKLDKIAPKKLKARKTQPPTTKVMKPLFIIAALVIVALVVVVAALPQVSPNISSGNVLPSVAEIDDGFTTITTQEILLGQTLEGQVNGASIYYDANNYLLRGKAGQIIRAQVTSGDPELLIYNSAGQELAYSDDYGENKNAEIILKLPEDDTYILRVRSWISHSPYILAVSEAPSGTDEVYQRIPSGYERSPTIKLAGDIRIGQTIKTSVDGRGSWTIDFLINGIAGESIHIHSKGYSSRVGVVAGGDLSLQTLDGEVIGEELPAGVYLHSQYVATFPEDGIYILRNDRSSDSIEVTVDYYYNFDVDETRNIAFGQTLTAQLYPDALFNYYHPNNYIMEAEAGQYIDVVVRAESEGTAVSLWMYDSHGLVVAADGFDTDETEVGLYGDLEASDTYIFQARVHSLDGTRQLNYSITLQDHEMQ